MQALGQLLRRCGNVLTALTGPWLFGAAPGLPWAVYGGVVALWALVLWGVLWAHARRIAPVKGAGPLAAFRPFVSRPWHVREVEYAEMRAAGGLDSEEEEGELLLETPGAAGVLWLRAELSELRLEVAAMQQQLREVAAPDKQTVRGALERKDTAHAEQLDADNATFASLLFP